MIFELTEDPNLFPDPNYGEPDGLVAIGGDLSPERLCVAYSNGFFPWYSFNRHDEILWYCPLERFVIFPKEIHISHSMKQLIKKELYHVTINQDFDRVIEHCSKADDRNAMEGAWLGKDMINAYKEMHRLNYAVSVEVWDKEKNLVGGLYGINIGKNFFGESMFSLVPSASKFALIALAQKMEELGDGGIIDCQFETEHLKSMGGRHIGYEEYMNMINYLSNSPI